MLSFFSEYDSGPKDCSLPYAYVGRGSVSDVMVRLG